MFNQKWTRMLLVMAMVAMVLVGCAAPADTPEQEAVVVEDSLYPLTIVDGFEREVMITEEPMKIVSLAPSVTETLFAIGAGDKLVGRTDYDTYPEAVNEITSVGSLSDPSIEAIVELAPDLVIASTHFKEEVLEKLEEVDIPVVVLIEQESFEGTYELIRKAGKITNTEDEANQVVAGMEGLVADVLDRVKDRTPVSVYYVVGFGEYGDFTATGETYISGMLEMAGGVNIAKDATGWSYSIEKVVEQKPEVLLCSAYFGAKDGIMAANGYKDLDAVKNGKLIEVDNNMIDRQGPRLGLGLLELAKAMHPDAFEGFEVK